MSITEKILCTKSHEYLLEDGKNYIIGLTDYAIEQLGDIVFVELPEVGASFNEGETFDPDYNNWVRINLATSLTNVKKAVKALKKLVEE